MDSNTPKNLNVNTETRMRVASRVADTSATHSYTQGEVTAYSEHINNYLSDDPHLKTILPLDPESL